MYSKITSNDIALNIMHNGKHTRTLSFPKFTVYYYDYLGQHWEIMYERGKDMKVYQTDERGVRL